MPTTVDAGEVMERIVIRMCPTEPTGFQLRMLAALKGHGIHGLYRTALRTLARHSRTAAYAYGRSNRRVMQRFLAAETGTPVDRLTGWLSPSEGQSTLRWALSGKARSL